MPYPKVASVRRHRNRRSKGRRLKSGQSKTSEFEANYWTAGSSSSSGQFESPTETKYLRPCQGKNTEEKRLSDLRKLRHCDMCGADGDHSTFRCLYQFDIPRDVKTLPPGYDMQCNGCDGILGKGDCTCLDRLGYDRWRRCAVRMYCCICDEVGGHWETHCPDAAELKKRLKKRIKAAQSKGLEAKIETNLLSELFSE